MKDFFDRLFGKKGSAPDTKKRAAAAIRSLSPDESFQPYENGDVIAGKYEVRRVLGKGGFGIVYHVRFRETGEDFALKTFKDELTADPAALEAFKKEALVWVNLERHLFILPAIWVEEIRQGRIATADGSGKLVLDAPSSQEPRGRLLVIMDYVEGDAQGRATLGEYLAGGRLDESQVLKWGIQFCLGMEHARAHGIECHRDIKPANIMITKDGTLKVSDFGLAIATESALRGFVGRIGSSAEGEDGDFGLSVIQVEGKAISGTPGYIAPEVCRSEGASVRSDIYSFGLVLWQMAAGSPFPPFRVPRGADTIGCMRAVYAQQVSGDIPRLEGPLGAVIERCLRPQHAERYGTFQELRAVLEPILERRTGRKFEMPQFTGKTAAVWNNKGGSLAALGRHEEAIRCYDTALEIDPQSPKTWNNKGSAPSALGRRDQALECFDRALAIDPRFAMAFENKGRELHILGRLEEALRCYDKALSLDSQDAGASQKKGAVLAAMGRHADAVACYDRALATTPKSVESLYNKGLSLIRLSKDAQASTCFDQVLAIDPRFEMAWINKGNLLATSGRHEDAVSCFDKAIAINSTNADAHNNNATSLAALGRCDEALVSCERALKVDPHHASAWAGKGAVLAAAGKFADAVACHNKALAIDAKNVVALCGKGSSLGASGQHSQALDYFERALAVEPMNAASLFGKAISEEMDGRLSDAAKTLRRFIEVAGPMYAGEIAAAKKHLADLDRRAAAKKGEQPGGHAVTAASWIKKAIALNESGRFSDAIECYDRALALDTNDASAWYWKGCALAKLHRHEDAVSSYRNAVRLDPKSAAPWFNMGHCLGLLGRHDEVIKCCARALEITPNDSQVWILKGMGFLSIERFDEAIHCFQQAAKLGDASAAAHIAECRRLQSRHAQHLFRRGSEFQETGNNAEAIRCYEAGLAIEPNNADVWVNKGAALLALTRVPEAVSCFERAISLNPHDASAWNNKGCALLSLGEHTEALACLQEAKRLRA